MTDKRPINPSDLCAPIGFAHGWLVPGGGVSTLYLAGQCAYDAEGEMQAIGDVAGQCDIAMRNIGSVLRDADMGFDDVVQLNFYVLSRDDYATARKEFGRVWKELCGRHYPAMAMFQVGSLFDPLARIEIQGIAAKTT